MKYPEMIKNQMDVAYSAICDALSMFEQLDEEEKEEFESNTEDELDNIRMSLQYLL